MLVTGDLGFPSLVLALCLVLPVTFVCRRKWRLAVARQEEIKRLLILASEEAARAELEASVGYVAVAAVARDYQCAVCYCPTTTRCARCKAVRYCSGKCQIVHWRQGHKEECHPPLQTQRITDVGNDSAQKISEEDHEIESDKFAGSQQGKPIEAFFGAPAFHSPSFPPEAQYEKDDDGKLESPVVGKETYGISGSSTSSFSGFSTSTRQSESSEDVSSFGESVSSVEPDSSDGHLSADGAVDMLQTSFSIADMSQSKPLSPKFASLVNSANDFSKLSEQNQIKSSCGSGESRCTSSCSSGLHNTAVRDGPNAAPCSCFWGKTLESLGSPGDTHNDYDASATNGDGTSKLSDSRSRSSLHFSFNLSGHSSPPLHAHGYVVKGAVSGDALIDALSTNKTANGAALSENTGVGLPKIGDSQSLNCEASGSMKGDSKSISHSFMSRETKPIHSSNDIGLCSASAEKLDNVVKDCSRTSNLSRTRESGCSLSSVSDSRIASGIRECSVASVKTRKDDPVDTSAAVSSLVSNSPNAKNGLKTSVRKVVEQFKGSKMSKDYPLRNGGEIAGRYTDKALFPYELFVKLYTWNKVELRPSGLINCGNSCYANAVLQCLAFTPPLTAYFLQGLHSKTCAKKEWCFACEFESLISKAKEGKSPLSPIGILSQLRNIGSQLGNGREEDAHEFLRYAIETMQSVCLKEAGVNTSSSLGEETTLIGLTFGGYLRSKIKCTKCQGKSERQESMMDLNVEIEGDIGTLEEALRQFTSTETLDGENKYQCSRCKSYEKAKKKLTILEAPNILTIALKRFQLGKFGKLNKPIRFPEILDLAPFMSGTSDKSPIYRLYGVVVHLDIMNAAFSGHYVCYVKNVQNKWFKIDDSTVTAVELEKVLTKGAYMLLYARCSPRAPRSIRNRIVCPDPRARAMPSWIGGKTTTLKSKSTSTNSSVSQFFPSSNPPEGAASFESFYSRFHRLQRILEEDSSSDNSSLISNNSDEGSCSTDSTRDSTSTDDLSDYIFGDSGRGWNSSWRSTSDSDTSSSSSSSSPLYSKVADLDQHESDAPETSRPQTDCANGLWDKLTNGNSRRAYSEREVPFLHSDTTKHCRKLSSSSSGSSNSREADMERLGFDTDNVKYDRSFRRSTRERTVNI
ncbi:hypothetical protein FNV43_RR12415 [Rhamnella rubrinervis]|uniref:ubiquitinyl hydrolase 1 n=1 Tax=Rhamnella rubrinervis TaxID=2594499 RepID=A0A8K0H7P5_9ROSA|nr:hypothetical protein FNV43_RR12415 [Rhamnella rubrinervis]